MFRVIAGFAYLYPLGSVDISSQRDNQKGCTDAEFFVGVGSPNPLVRFPNLLCEAEISIVRLSIHNRTVGARFPRPLLLFHVCELIFEIRRRPGIGRGNLAPTITGISRINANTP